MTPLRLVIFGRQGAGKGTQSEMLADKYGVIHISTGDMLREALAEKEEIGLRAKEYLDAGELVPDGVMLEVIKNRFDHDDVVRNGFLLDGFPRTRVQAEGLLRITGIDVAINLEVPHAVVMERMLERKRSDDTPEAITARLDAYETKTLAAIAWLDAMGKVVTVDGVGEPDEVFDRLVEAIERRLDDPSVDDRP